MTVNLSATDPASAGGGAPKTHDVNATPNAWDPAAVQAAVGDTVRWNFPASAAVAARRVADQAGRGAGLRRDPGDQRPIKLPGDPPVSTSLSQAGTYTFVCKLHSFKSEGRWQGMVGTAVAAAAPSVPGSGVDYTEYRVNGGDVDPQHEHDRPPPVR